MVDAGCGRGEFIRYMLNAKSPSQFIGIDFDQKEIERAREVCAKLFTETGSTSFHAIDLIKNTPLTDQINLISHDQPLILVMIEVIEHINMEDHVSLYSNLSSQFDPDYIFLTTPNADFNHFFKSMLSNGLRHLDHRFELGEKEFEEYCHGIAGYEVVEIGGVTGIDRDKINEDAKDWEKVAVS